MDIKAERDYMKLADMLRESMEARDARVRDLLLSGDLEEIERYAGGRRELLRQALDRDFECEKKQPSLIKSITMAGYRIDCYLLPGAGGCDVPVNVYIPSDAEPGKTPAVIVPVGHWPAGKAEENVQRLCAGFALRGIIAATYDPVNQGERCPVNPEEYLGARPGLREDMLPVAMHMLPGNLFYMLGENLGSLFVWEGKRVCDLLCSLGEVDKSRIGVTGQSGGGTQSLYLAALDERIIACSPAQCLTKLAGIVANTGIGDCEQSILGICGDSCFDYADFLWALYPKALMINAALDDYYALDGVTALFGEIRSLYRFSGSACEMRVAAGGHVMGSQSRLYTLDFFCEVFGVAKPGTYTEPAVLEPGMLKCMEQKAVSASMVARRLFESKLRDRLDRSRTKTLRKDEGNGCFMEQVKHLLCSAPLPAAEFWEDTGGRLFLQAGAASLEALLGRPRDDAELLLFLGPVEAFSEADRPGGPWVIADPWSLSLAMEKHELGYDAETRLFNLGAMMGFVPAAVRCALISLLIDELGKRGWHVDAVTIAARGLAGIQALYTAAAETRIVKVSLQDTPESLDAFFFDDTLILPETLILPGLAAICDLRGLADCQCADVAWNRGSQAPGRK